MAGDSLEVSSEEIAVGPYSDDADDEDDVVTLQMDAPLDDGEWMVQTSVQDRRRLSTAELSAEQASGALPASTRVWRNGMRAWTPLGEVDFAAVAAGALKDAGAKPRAENRAAEELAASSARPLVPPLAAPPKRLVPPLPSPPPPRIAAPPSRPGVSLAAPSSPALGLGSLAVPASARALGSSPASAVAFGAPRALGLSPLPPRVELPRSAPPSPALPAADAPAPARRVDTATSVALDVGPVAPRRSRRWGALAAQGAAAVVALLGTSYALTRAGVFEPGATAVGREAPVSARLALQPAVVPVAAPVAAAPAAEQATAALPAAPVAAAASSDHLEPTAASGAATAAAPSAVASNPVAASPVVAVPEAVAGVVASSSGAAAEAPGVAKDSPADVSGASGGAQQVAVQPEPAAPSEADSGRADPGSRRARRAARRAAALEAHRQRHAQAEPVRTTEVRTTEVRTTEERSEAASSTQEQPGNAFDRQAAQAALTAAAEQAKNCRPIGGPSGAGTVQVQYEPSGRVGAVTIVTPGFENSAAASCIEMLFRRAKVAAFNGAKGAVMRQRFEIP